MAIYDKATVRFETDLAKLNTRLEKERLKDPEKIQQALGHLKERHHRVSRFYNIQVQPANQDSTAQVIWQQVQNPWPVYGGYLLRTSRRDLSPAEIWHKYM